MCSTKWCYGDCDECIADKKREKEYEEADTACPHREECKVVTIDDKKDCCKTCGKVFNY